MYDKDGFRTETFPAPHLSDTLKQMTEEEFAALGAETIAFRRAISAGDLSGFVPQAADMPDNMQFQMLMSADGSPILISDNDEAVADWLEEHEIALVERH